MYYGEQSLLRFCSLIQLLMKVEEICSFARVSAGPDRYQENNNPYASDSTGLLVVKNSRLLVVKNNHLFD